MSSLARKIAFRDGADRAVVIGSGGPSFQLVGEEIRDANVNRGPLFAGMPPRISVTDGSWEAVGTVVFGEEGRGTARWRTSFRPDSGLVEQELPPEIVERKAGWYFLRFYDRQDGLIDSIDFRFSAGLRQITTTSCQPLPTATGHEWATVEIEHEVGWSVEPLKAHPRDVKVERTADGTTLRIPPAPECDLTDWKHGPSSGPMIEIAFLIERVWYAVADLAKPPSEWWENSPPHLSAGDFTVTSEKAIWLRLPQARWADSVFAGFRSENRREYTVKVAESTLAIPLRDFSDAQALAERTKDCTLKIWANGYEATVAVVPAETTGDILQIDCVRAQHLAEALTRLGAVTRGPVHQLLREVRRRYRRPANSKIGHNAGFVKQTLCAFAVLLQLPDAEQPLWPEAAGRWKRKARLAGMEFPATTAQIWRRYRELEGRTTQN